MRTDPPNGIEVELFIALLANSFGAGTGMREVTPEGLRYPLKKYRKNIERLAQKWPSTECDTGLSCAYRAGKKAAAYANEAGHPGKIDDKCVQKACDDLEKERGPICVPIPLTK